MEVLHCRKPVRIEIAMTALTSEDVLRASRVWHWSPTGAEALEIEGISVLDCPDWARIRFYAMPEDVERPQSGVAAVRDAARQRGYEAVHWWISHATSLGVEAELVRQGAVLLKAMDIVGLDISRGVPSLPGSSAVVAYVVEDAQRLDDAERVTAQVWGNKPSSGERRELLLRSLGHPLDKDGAFRVVAYVGERAVCSAGCQVVGDVCRLTGGGTLSDSRGLPGYRAATIKRLEVARQAGARIAVGRAVVDTSKPIVASLGFSTYGEARL